MWVFNTSKMTSITSLPKDILVNCVGKHACAICLAKLAGTCRRLWITLGNHRKIVTWKAKIKKRSINHLLFPASVEGSQCLVDFFIKKGAYKLDEGLHGAARGGHKDLVEFFIAKGANLWNWGLRGASHGGHKELIDFFIAKGANEWNLGLAFASMGGHKELIKFFENKLASNN